MTTVETKVNKRVIDSRVREFITPTRIVWKSEDDLSAVENAEVLLASRDGQATLAAENACILSNNGASAGILLDYGLELHGGVQITAWIAGGEKKRVNLRVRFGESVMEAMSEIGGELNATNDHAIRDQIIEVSFLGATEIGNTGFRFVRIDLMDENSFIELKSVRAVEKEQYIM